MKIKHVFIFLGILFGLGCDEAETRFAIVGDPGQAGNPALLVSNMVQSWKPDFIVTTGDNNYPKGDSNTLDLNIGQYYAPFILNYLGSYGAGSDTLRFIPILGNHDWDSDTGANPYLAYFSLPGNERYYDVLKPYVHLFILDSDPREPDGISEDSIQAQWLKKTLANSSAPWKIVLLHHPPYSSSSVHGSTPTVQWPFKKWGASAVVSGHDHLYERLTIDELPYIVNGLGGVENRYTAGTILPESQLVYSENYGAMEGIASLTRLVLSFKTVDGVDVDLLTLSK